MTLFADADAERRLTPLAERMRPRTLGEVAGQPEAVEVLRELTSRARLPSLILWGPPGCGKTTIARLLAGDKYYFEPMSAVLAGVKDVRSAVDAAKLRRQRDGQGTLLFLDEIHRFNKAQQDVLLPHVENGTLVLVGATTENPSFEVIGPLLSRCRVIVLRALEADDTEALLWRALTDERGLGLPRAAAEAEAIKQIAQLAAGDARFALNTLEVCASLVGTGPAPSAAPQAEDDMALPGPAPAVSDSAGGRESPRQAAAITGWPETDMADGAGPVPTVITSDVLKRALAGRSLLYDKTGEEHFNAISALHKSLRGSDPDAALYWMARMLEGGEDPKYVVRRMIRFASEDIGLADPWALVHAIAAKDAVEFIGMPECNNALAQLCVYLASAPKSNAMYTAYSAARAAVKQHGALPAPLNIRNAPTQLMKDLDYGKDYKYAHDYEGGFVADNYWPDALAGQPPRFIKLTGRGMEKQILERLRKWWGGKYEGEMGGASVGGASVGGASVPLANQGSVGGASVPLANHGSVGGASVGGASVPLANHGSVGGASVGCASVPLANPHLPTTLPATGTVTPPKLANPHLPSTVPATGTVTPPKLANPHLPSIVPTTGTVTPPQPEGVHKTRRRLPHWTLEGSTYFITWRLAEGQRPLTPDERDLVVSALRHFNGERYQLDAFVVMDDHVHVVFRPLGDNSVSKTTHSWKSYTGHELAPGRGGGQVWQHESYDRIVRDEAEWREKCEYVLTNPQRRWPDMRDYPWAGTE